MTIITCELDRFFASLPASPVDSQWHVDFVAKYLNRLNRLISKHTELELGRHSPAPRTLPSWRDDTDLAEEDKKVASTALGFTWVNRHDCYDLIDQVMGKLATGVADHFTAMGKYWSHHPDRDYEIEWHCNYMGIFLNWLNVYVESYFNIVPVSN